MDHIKQPNKRAERQKRAYARGGSLPGTKPNPPTGKRERIRAALARAQSGGAA